MTPFKDVTEFKDMVRAELERSYQLGVLHGRELERDVCEDLCAEYPTPDRIAAAIRARGIA